ncbi:hypothetical protein VKT23_007437 [Stygiomarasmius scandens]|uniref:Uncharacterized protein n=1 Tax=Marasmiellus scandens TaxID=2682957 RepID=A0ABR1JKU4_9AGAR
MQVHKSVILVISTLLCSSNVQVQSRQSFATHYKLKVAHHDFDPPHRQHLTMVLKDLPMITLIRGTNLCMYHITRTQSFFTPVWCLMREQRHQQTLARTTSSGGGSRHHINNKPPAYPNPYDRIVQTEHKRSGWGNVDDRN